MSAFKIYSIYSFFLTITYFTTYCTAKLSRGQEVCNTLCTKRDIAQMLDNLDMFD